MRNEGQGAGGAPQGERLRPAALSRAPEWRRLGHTCYCFQASLALCSLSIEIHQQWPPTASLSSRLPPVCTTMLFIFSFIIIHVKLIFSSIVIEKTWKSNSMHKCTVVPGRAVIGGLIQGLAFSLLQLSVRISPKDTRCWKLLPGGCSWHAFLQDQLHKLHVSTK